MGEDFVEKTKFIFRSLLTLGLLEASKKPLTKDEILMGIGGTTNAKYRSQVNRFIEHILAWLSDEDQNLVTIAENDKRENVYSIDFENLKRKEYIDFLNVLLTLNEIWIKDTDDAVIDLYEKEGDKPLGIVTKLMLAIKENKSLLISYKNINHEIKFLPKLLFKSEYKWLVEGRILNSEDILPPLEIASILNIK